MDTPESSVRLVPELPALLPKVRVDWDPKTVSELGLLVSSPFRMDVLMLLPVGIRVVLEVEGSYRFAHDSGRAPVRTARRRS